MRWSRSCGRSPSRRCTPSCARTISAARCARRNGRRPRPPSAGRWPASPASRHRSPSSPSPCSGAPAMAARWGASASRASDHAGHAVRALYLRRHGQHRGGAHRRARGGGLRRLSTTGAVGLHPPVQRGQTRAGVRPPAACLARRRGKRTAEPSRASDRARAGRAERHQRCSNPRCATCSPRSSSSVTPGGPSTTSPIQLTAAPPTRATASRTAARAGWGAQKHSS